MDEQTLTDEQLLRRANLQKDRSAIDTLIRRYTNLVYGIALRQTRSDAQLAADISQAVFIVFVRRLGSIKHGRALPAWFHKTTCFAVRDARRAAHRRFHHEQLAARPEPTMNASNPPEQIEHVELIDQAIAALGKTDRDLVLMHYMQGREVASIALDIGITEQTARKRLTRAIDRMRGFFAARGTVLSGAALTGLLASAAVHPAPAAVIEASTVVASPTVAATTIAKGVGQTMVWSQYKLVGGLCAGGILAAIAVAVLAVQMQGSRSQAASPTATAPSVVDAPMSLEQATAELKVAYALGANEAIRMIKAPFPPSRTVWANAKNPEARGADNIHSLGFRLRPNGELDEWYMLYPDLTLNFIVGSGLRLEWYEIEGLDRVNWKPVRADIVMKETSTTAEKLDGLAMLIGQETGLPVRFAKVTRTRPCIVLVGGGVTGGLRDSGNFDVLVLTQEPFDNDKLAGWVKGPRPSGSAHSFQIQPATKYLGAPFIDGRPPNQQGEADIAGHRGLPSSSYFIFPDAKLDLADPEYQAKLQRIVDNMQKQIGGEWKIEKRDLETFVLEPAP